MFDDKSLMKATVGLVVCSIGMVVAQAFTPGLQSLNPAGLLFAFPWCVCFVYIGMGLVFRFVDWIMS